MTPINHISLPLLSVLCDEPPSCPSPDRPDPKVCPRALASVWFNLRTPSPSNCLLSPINLRNPSLANRYADSFSHTSFTKSLRRFRFRNGPFALFPLGTHRPARRADFPCEIDGKQLLPSFGRGIRPGCCTYAQKRGEIETKKKFVGIASA